MSSYEEISIDELWEKVQSGELEERADALSELGSRHYQDEKWEIARDLYGAAIDLYEQLERSGELPRNLYWLAYCQFRIKETTTALETLQRSLEISFENNDSRGIAHCSSLMGDCYKELQNNSEAVQSYELSMECYAEVEDNWNLGLSCLSAGEIHGTEERLTRALECFIRAFNSFQSCGDAFGAARAKDRMASALIELGDVDQALQHIQDAMDTFDFLEAEERYFHMKFRFGWTLVLAGEFEKAQAPLLESIVKFKEMKEWSRAALAEVQLANALWNSGSAEDREESQRILNRAGVYFECAGEMANLLMVESTKAQRLAEVGETQAAIMLFRSLIRRGIETQDSYIERTCKTLLAELLAEQGELSEARGLLETVSVSSWGDNKFELERLLAAQTKVANPR